MKILISNKYYKTKEEAIEKLDVFFAMGKLTIDEYMELTMLAETVYTPPVVEPLPEEVPVEGTLAV
ncbi:hypothetical protein PBV87_11460 [Niameybacter massiliensis]|uniref:Uncharacterized protein n=1 Tax=Holtiella tumoricola TaxID=3018743 RepID=A0AA42DN72_9FIRM|nr:hypothetical protein [Holtiella tumoricola]MDA3732100.1 hypothetical protein [Holtiella tumoricola]